MIYKNLVSLLRNIEQWRCKQRIKIKRGLERNFLVYLLCILLYFTIGDEDGKHNVTESCEPAEPNPVVFPPQTPTMASASASRSN